MLCMFECGYMGIEIEMFDEDFFYIVWFDGF